MPLWAALPRHQTLVYIIFACVHTTRKDVRSIYRIYVAYILAMAMAGHCLDGFC